MYRGEPPKEYYSREWAIAHLEGDSGESKWPILHPDIEGTLVNRHRIMGASSTGKNDDLDVDGFGALDDGGEGGDRLEEGPWLKPSSTLPNGEKCFIEATKSKASNQKKDNYIFGRGELGFGYYHIRTKEACKILFERIDKRIRAKEVDLGWVNFWNCFCLSSASGRAKLGTIQEEINELVEVRGVVAAICRADSPTGVVGLPSNVMKNPARKVVVNKYYDEHTHSWKFPASFYDAGGGCGTTIDGLGMVYANRVGGGGGGGGGFEFEFDFGCGG